MGKDWTKPGAWKCSTPTPEPLKYETTGSCGHRVPSGYSFGLCDDCAKGLPPLRDEQALAGLPRSAWKRALRRG